VSGERSLPTRKAGAVARKERIDRIYSRLPVAVRRVINRTRLRVRAGNLVARDWARRPALDAEHYWQSIDQPHRRVLLDQLRTFGSPRSPLELGSHSGPNLRLAAREFPQARVGGIEINGAVVARARQLLRDDGLDRVELTVGSVVDLLPVLADDSEDLVFSCFALAYLPPGQLVGVLRHSLRVARLGLVLVEPQVRERQRVGLMRETAGWRHHYAAALRGIGVHPQAMRMIDLPGAPAYLNGCLVADLRPPVASRGA
jgi:ubiquinone/menaquinone biosynthesis C-methylase UbiE